MPPCHVSIIKPYVSTMLGSQGMCSFELSEINELNGLGRMATLAKFSSLTSVFMSESVMVRRRLNKSSVWDPLIHGCRMCPNTTLQDFWITSRYGPYGFSGEVIHSAMTTSGYLLNFCEVVRLYELLVCMDYRFSLADGFINMVKWFFAADDAHRLRDRARQVIVVVIETGYMRWF